MSFATFAPAAFQGSQASLEPALDAMLRSTLTAGERVLMCVQANVGEGLVVTSSRVIILKSASRDAQGKGYGRFFGLETILRFEYRGWLTTNFIAVITGDTANIPLAPVEQWRCSHGVTFVGRLGNETAKYLKELTAWLLVQHRQAFLHGPLQPIVATGVSLMPGEHFFFETAAAYFKEQTVRQHAGRSSSVSIPIVSGVRMRVGGSEGNWTDRSVLMQDDRGVVAIGNRRVVFTGSHRNVSIALPSIATVQAYTDGFQVAVTNRAAVQFRTKDDLAGLMLKRLLGIP